MVTLLAYADGELFATGAVSYDYLPATAEEDLSRIILPVNIEGVTTPAVLDTGAPYVICSPKLARQFVEHTIEPIYDMNLLIRGIVMKGKLYRVNLTFIADVGENLSVDVTAFIPDPEYAESWGALPSFIGLGGCLERIRFAIDPGEDIFYFGPLY